MASSEQGLLSNEFHVSKKKKISPFESFEFQYRLDIFRLTQNKLEANSIT